MTLEIAIPDRGTRSIMISALLLALSVTPAAADEIATRKNIPNWSPLTSHLAGEGCVIASQSPMIAEAKPGTPSGSWRAMSIGSRSTIEGRAPTLQFLDKGGVSGSTGCNSYSGRAVGFGSSVRFGSLAMTEMSCPDAGAMHQEQAYLEAIGNVSRWEMQEEQALILRNAAGEEILRFTR